MLPATTPNRCNRSLKFQLRNTRVKLCIVHPALPWLATVTQTNVFSLWNYEQSFVIKTFNANTLDDFKPTDVKELLFWDRHSVKPLLANTNNPNSPNRQRKNNNWIVFCTQRKVFLYDYSTDANKLGYQKDLDFRTIRKIEIVAEDALAIGLTDGTIRIFDSQNWSLTKTIRGYHNKPVNWIVPYKQNENQKPRIIAASTDSLMCCWNLDPNIPVIETPSFKFLMKKNKAVDSNQGQEIVCISCDIANFRLLTVTESYVTIWSTLSGSQMKRFRNVMQLREIQFFRHFDFQNDSFIAHNRSEDLYIATPNLDPKMQNTSSFDCVVLVSLKDLLTQEADKLTKMVWMGQERIMAITTSGLFILEINKRFKENRICHHECFQTRLTIANSREFYNNQAVLKSAPTPYAINSMQFRHEQFYNVFYLRSEKGILNYHLVQIKLKDMSTKKAVFKLADLSILLRDNNPQIKSSSEGTELSIHSPTTGYFQIHSVVNPKSELVELDDFAKLDFYSKLEVKVNGIATDIAWHPYKIEFIAVQPVNKQGNFVNYKAPNAKAPNILPGLDSNVAGHQLVVYSRNIEQTQYFIIYKMDLQSASRRVFAGGPYFAYSSILKPSQAQNPSGSQPPAQKKQGTSNLEVLEFLDTDSESIKARPTSLQTPIQLYWDYSFTLCIMVYDTHFTVMRVDSKGNLSYLKTIYSGILSGYFWEKLFFYTTRDSIQCLYVSTEVVNIQLTMRNIKSLPARQFDIFGGSESAYLDSFESWQLEQTPLGQLKILSIVNMALLMINEHLQVILLKINNVFVRFAMEVMAKRLIKAGQIYTKIQGPIKKYLDELLRNHGISQNQLLRSIRQ